MTTTTHGRVARVTGPVVDVEFPVEAMPSLYNALHVDVDFGDGNTRPVNGSTPSGCAPETPPSGPMGKPPLSPMVVELKV